MSQKWPKNGYCEQPWYQLGGPFLVPSFTQIFFVSDTGIDHVPVRTNLYPSALRAVQHGYMHCKCVAEKRLSEETWTHADPRPKAREENEGTEMPREINVHKQKEREDKGPGLWAPPHSPDPKTPQVRPPSPPARTHTPEQSEINGPWREHWPRECPEWGHPRGNVWCACEWLADTGHRILPSTKFLLQILDNDNKMNGHKCYEYSQCDEIEGQFRRSSGVKKLPLVWLAVLEWHKGRSHLRKLQIYFRKITS